MPFQRSLLILSLAAAAALTACGKKDDAQAAASAAASAADVAASAASAAASAATATASAAAATAASAASVAADVKDTAKKVAGDAKGGKIDAAAGEALYKSTCSVCHATGVAGAPKFGDKADWGPRIAQGDAVLFKHALEGFQGQKGVMPPKGGSTASDDEVKSAVKYMTSQIK
ncbi:cytochrome c5 family protein [Brachymonas sp.]|uniref:c-type cytochrome n=1 Tax=Brachymonas sp. TaxID=1936292 RepID=UPI0035B3ADF8